MKLHFTLRLTLFCSLLASCGSGSSKSTSDAEPIPAEYSLNGVKLISEGNENGLDPVTYLQEEYSLTNHQRLLLRFEELSAHADKIRADDTHPITLKVTLSEGQFVDQARSAIRVCPILKNWMMAATWTYAFSGDESGKWEQPGGDFESIGCVRATKIEVPSPSPSPTPGLLPEEGESLVLEFNLTPWFKNYVKGREQNLGLVLITESEFKIRGDRSGTQSPHIHWFE